MSVLWYESAGDSSAGLISGSFYCDGQWSDGDWGCVFALANPVCDEEKRLMLTDGTR